jgi:hypothetical protein
VKDIGDLMPDARIIYYIGMQDAASIGNKCRMLDTGYRTPVYRVRTVCRTVMQYAQYRNEEDSGLIIRSS